MFCARYPGLATTEGGMQEQQPGATQAMLAAESAMRRALELATRGPVEDPNPQVGCVIVSPDQRIVAEGWHMGAGTAHAETDALDHLPAEWRARAYELTAVVTLEPCNHTGHTGPCAQALIEAEIGTVIYAISDPGIHSRGGAERLKSAGITVHNGVLADQAQALLDPWLSARSPSANATPQNRPYIIAKWAQTLDGRAAAADGSSQWITGPEARADVHLARSQADAILVGTGTLLVDDPNLTARTSAGELLVPPSSQPIPVVLGRRAIPAVARIRQHPALPTHELDSPIHLTGEDLESDMRQLKDQGIHSLYIEGGPTVTSALLAAGLVDELQVYIAASLLGGPRLALSDIGVSSIAEILQLQHHTVTPLGRDLRVTATLTPPAQHLRVQSLEESEQ